MATMQMQLENECDAICASRELAHSLTLNLCGKIFKVVSNSGSVIEKLTDYFEGFITRPFKADCIITAIQAPRFSFDADFKPKKAEPGKTKLKEMYSDFGDGRAVRKILTGVHMLMTSRHNIVIGPCLGNINQVVNFINNRYIEMFLNHGALLLHAAAVEKDGFGLGICGFSGRGKSTLMLGLLRQGCKFVSNDRLMLAKTGDGLIMYGLAKMPRVNPGTILNNPDLKKMLPPAKQARLRKMPLKELWTLEDKYDVDVRKIYGPDKFILQAPMKALIILDWKLDNGPFVHRKIKLAQRKDLFEAFSKDPGLFYQPTDGFDQEKHRSFEGYLKFLRLIDVYEFSGGVDQVKALEVCDSIIIRNK